MRLDPSPGSDTLVVENSMPMAKDSPVDIRVLTHDLVLFNQQGEVLSGSQGR